MIDSVDARAVLAAADRAADIAEEGWAAYLAGPQPYAAISTAVTACRRIPTLLRPLRTVIVDGDQWWQDHSELHADPDAVWVGQLRTVLESREVGPLTHDDHLGGLSRALMRRAPRGAVSTFVNDELGRSGWTVRLPDGTVLPIYLTVPPVVARRIAAALVHPDGRSIEQVFPGVVIAMRTLTESAYERLGLS